MEARAKILGHPVHQMLIPIPLGLFITATILDIVAMIGGWSSLMVVSFWNLVIGVAAALVAAVFGLIDWTAIPKGTRAKRVGAAHGGGNVVMVGLFLIAVLLRMDEPSFAVTGGALVLEIVALAIGVVTGWLGGELVDRYGIGVHPDAHPNASSSLRAVRRARRKVSEAASPAPPSGGAPTPAPGA
ncbi:MAG TPA: DUF2231 domain-containing protein [Sandaracinaceae bacterium]